MSVPFDKGSCLLWLCEWQQPLVLYHDISTSACHAEKFDKSWDFSENIVDWWSEIRWIARTHRPWTLRQNPATDMYGHTWPSPLFWLVRFPQGHFPELLPFYPPIPHNANRKESVDLFTFFTSSILQLWMVIWIIWILFGCQVLWFRLLFAQILMPRHA